MTIENLLSDLNEYQKAAASIPRQHALVLAGAGCGKTKTIIARAAYLISKGTPANRIHILTFTRRSSAEIVERVRMNIGDIAEGLRASTFHTWCISLIRKLPAAFGCKGYTVIDRDDQLQLFKLLRGKSASKDFPSAKQICDIYSYARNTTKSLDATLQKNSPDLYKHKEILAQVMIAYEGRKRERRYLDYDDILAVVANRLATSLETRAWVAGQYDHLLVDEMQDTNPLQWQILDPLKGQSTLFCVGDDAQSIYGFRGADFRNVHSFTERVPGATILRLERNYRSTQEILDVSNWLLSESPLQYGKELAAARGNGNRPQLHTFSNEWEEGRWIVEDIIKRRTAGSDWRNHMILVRSSFSGRAVESALLANDIPYRFVGGTKLLESAHVRDALSVLRLVANFRDEIAWMRYLTLWKGVGEVTASKLVDNILSLASIDDCFDVIQGEPKLPAEAHQAIRRVLELQDNVAQALAAAVESLSTLLSTKYQNQEWDKRKRDFQLVGRLAEKHTSILGFIEEYLLDPVHGSLVERPIEDAVTLITIHSAKGTECDVCYVVGVSPGGYPSKFSQGDADDVEEERRVLYVALTRAKNDLIVTRNGYQLWATDAVQHYSTDERDVETYFFNTLPDNLFVEHIHRNEAWRPAATNAPTSVLNEPANIGIEIG